MTVETLFPITRRSLLRGLGGASAVLSTVPAAGAQDPRPYRVVIPFPPGGAGTATMAPLMGPLAERLGAPVELDYRPGAGGNVATLHVVRSDADGHTLLLGHPGPLAINQHINPRSYFDPLKDLAPVAGITRYPLVICIVSRFGVRTLADFIKLARSRELVFGSSGNGSIQHVAGEIFRLNVGFKMLHVPFAGDGPMQEALIRGDIEVLFETGSNIVQHVKSGLLTPLAVMGPERLSMLPDTPILSELGYPGLYVSAWFGLLAPAATPVAVRDAQTAAIFDVFRSSEIQKQFEAMGASPVPVGPSAFAALIEEESDRWSVVVRDAKIKPD
ncbi:tripartite tricarboxylate transporter substrate binding protein [Terrarubrum flagellatum]|uniref:Bug family tripartite tricarboxylate transporter substrate binding protein n=1 Tax=Terrirubrum flagellatum TaxID=2895980 RepID=UPI00314530EB